MIHGSHLSMSQMPFILLTCHLEGESRLYFTDKESEASQEQETFSTSLHGYLVYKQRPESSVSEVPSTPHGPGYASAATEQVQTCAGHVMKDSLEEVAESIYVALGILCRCHCAPTPACFNHSP